MAVQAKRPRPRSQRVVCTVCGRIVRAYVPQHGDGTGAIPYRHKDKERQDCDGSLTDSTEFVDG